MDKTKAVRIFLSPPVRAQLEEICRAGKSEHRLVVRSRIILAAAGGAANGTIAKQLGLCDKAVRKWRARFQAHPVVESLNDAPRSGRPPIVPVEVRCELVKLACDRPEGDLAPFRNVWSLTALREALLSETGWDLSKSEIQRTLAAEDIRPHRVRMWLHSPDPDFRGKVRKICDLYLNPPPGATVLCVDEKTGMQALERRYPFTPATKGRPGRDEFEYVRHGTRALIAAFDVQTGEVTGRCGERRGAADLEEFMEHVARKYKKGDVYIVWDNLNIHFGERWRTFNERHGNRFHFVHTPLHASWVNQIEIWFGILQRRVLRHGSFVSGDDLARNVLRFIAHWNTSDAHPFRWLFTGHFGARRRAG